MLEIQKDIKKQTQSYGKSAAAPGSSQCGEQVNSRRKCQPSSVAGVLLKINIAKVIGPVYEEEELDNDIGRKWMPRRSVSSSRGIGDSISVRDPYLS